MMTHLTRGLAFVLLFAIAPVQAQTWSQAPNTALMPAMDPRFYVSGPQAVFNPRDIFANSGGDLASWNGRLGFFIAGGGHAATPDNSLFFIPLAGTGPERLLGPYYNDSGPGGGYLYKQEPPREIYPPFGIWTDAIRSRHTYGCIIYAEKLGQPIVFMYAGGQMTGDGGGVGDARWVDLSLTYAQQMARADMGWQRAAQAPWPSQASQCGWDPTKKQVVIRSAKGVGAWFPDTNTWQDWGLSNVSDATFCCDFNALPVMDVAGRWMYVLGDSVAERYHLDTHAYEPLRGRPWAAPFAVRTWQQPPAYPAWALSWHERTKQLIVATWEATGAPRPLQLINPVTDVVTTLTMSGDLPNATTLPMIYGRFRAIPGTDQVAVVVPVPTQNAYIGTMALAGSPPPVPVPVPIPTPLPVPVPPPAPPIVVNPLVDITVTVPNCVDVKVNGTLLPGACPPAAPTAIYLGVDQDRTGYPNSLVPDGVLDHHIRLSGITKPLSALTIDAVPPSDGKWATPFNGTNWTLLVAPSLAAPTDLWFSWYKPTLGYTVTLTYASGETVILTTTTALTAAPMPPGCTAFPCSQPAPVPTPTPVPTPVPVPTPPPTPNPTAPSSGTIRVPPGGSIPVRQWVERPLPFVGGWSDDWVAPDVSLRGLGPSKHTRTFYHPAYGMVIAGGDRAVSMPRGGYADGTGTEIIALDPITDTWQMLRPFCVPGEPQPNRPDNVGWAFDSKRNQAILTPGFFFNIGSACGAIEPPWTPHAFDFATRKFIPLADLGYPPPPGGWGGDQGSSYSIYDPVSDDFIRIYGGPEIQRLNLITKLWTVVRFGLTPTWNPIPNRAQLVIDTVGRAVYWLDAYGDGGGFAAGVQTPPRGPALMKISLVDNTMTVIPIPPGKLKATLSDSGGGDIYLVFDPINRVVALPNNVGMGGQLYGFGFYNVDTGAWEWEAAPPAGVNANLWGFHAGLGAFVGMGKRFLWYNGGDGPAAYYLYRYK